MILETQRAQPLKKSQWILGIGENPGTRLNAKLACKSCNWIVIYPTMLSFFSGID